MKRIYTFSLIVPRCCVNILRIMAQDKFDPATQRKGYSTIYRRADFFRRPRGFSTN